MQFYKQTKVKQIKQTSAGSDDRKNHNLLFFPNDFFFFSTGITTYFSLASQVHICFSHVQSLAVFLWAVC